MNTTIANEFNIYLTKTNCLYTSGENIINNFEKIPEIKRSRTKTGSGQRVRSISINLCKTVKWIIENLQLSENYKNKFISFIENRLEVITQ